MFLDDWEEQRGNLVGGFLQDILMVEPDSLVVGELGTSLRALRDIEKRHQFIEGKQFLLCARIPAQQGQEINHRLGEIAVFTIAARDLTRLRVMPLQREYGESQTVAITLGEFTLAIRFQQQGQMRKLRHCILPAKSLIEQYMKRRTWQPLLTTDNVRDLHQMVVDNVSQMVGRQLICTLIEHLIIKNVRLHTHLATNQVVDQYLLACLNLKAYHILLTIGNQLIHFLLRQCQRIAHLVASVAVVLEILDFLTLGLQLFRGIESNVSLVGIEQLLHIFLIDIATLALTVRTLIATKRDTLIKLDTQPLKRLNDILLCTRHETIGVSILNAEYQIAAMLLGKQIIVQGGTHTTDMQSSRRTRCKTHPYSSF